MTTVTLGVYDHHIRCHNKELRQIPRLQFCYQYASMEISGRAFQPFLGVPVGEPDTLFSHCSIKNTPTTNFPVSDRNFLSF